MLKQNKIALFICLLFFVAYSTLSIIRHLHYGSYGFDLGISDQIVWQYSHFQAPITTVQSYPFTSILTDHVEFIYVLLSPFYWFFSSPVTLLLLQVFLISFSGVPIYLLAKKRRLKPILCFSLLISYLMFYGIQNALWFDVHSLAFGAAFLAWFIYFLDVKNTLWAIVAFVLAIICKEDIALLTGAVSFVYLLKRKDKFSLSLLLVSGVYLFSVFYIYFPHFTQDGYRYQEKGGLFSNLNTSYFYDTSDKRNTIFYSLAWFGFVPLLAPMFLLPALADITHYFIFAHTLGAAQGFFLHYRVSLAPLLILPTIIALSKFRKLNNKYIAIYFLLVAIFFQYYFHLPLSYLTKRWFWTEPASVKSINAAAQYLPANASIVAQNNITPHISHRDLIFTLYPSTKDFSANSPCKQKTCNWFRWAGNPEYLMVSTSTDWDSRGFLASREDFIKGLQNLEKSKFIKKYFQKGDTIIYKVQRKP